MIFQLCRLPLPPHPEAPHAVIFTLPSHCMAGHRPERLPLFRRENLACSPTFPIGNEQQSMAAAAMTFKQQFRLV
jgi:hypothetical protein